MSKTREEFSEPSKCTHRVEVAGLGAGRHFGTHTGRYVMGPDDVQHLQRLMEVKVDAVAEPIWVPESQMEHIGYVVRLGMDFESSAGPEAAALAALSLLRDEDPEPVTFEVVGTDSAAYTVLVEKVDGKFTARITGAIHMGKRFEPGEPS